MRSVAASAAGDRSQGWLRALRFVYLPALYVFGFLDAYFTAREINRGIDPTLVDNPRVASALNFLTRGLGYFYLGERMKGLVVFVGMSVVQVAFPALLRRAMVATAVSIVSLALSAGMAIDGYRVGRRSFEAQIEGLDSSPTPRRRTFRPRCLWQLEASSPRCSRCSSSPELW